MTQFIYQTSKELKPRPGRKFATTYYQQTHQEHQRVIYHIQKVIRACLEQLDKQGELDTIIEPLPEFPRTPPQPNYNFWDIVSDLHDYLIAGNDIPSGMLGRWNRLFSGIDDFQIHLLTANEVAELKQKSFKDLFIES